MMRTVVWFYPNLDWSHKMIVVTSFGKICPPASKRLFCWFWLVYWKCLLSSKLEILIVGGMSSSIHVQWLVSEINVPILYCSYLWNPDRKSKQIFHFFMYAYNCRDEVCDTLLIFKSISRKPNVLLSGNLIDRQSIFCAVNFFPFFYFFGRKRRVLVVVGIDSSSIFPKT